MRATIVSAVVALLVAGPVGAATPEAERTARAHFQAGEAKFKAGAFDEALAEYQAGYDVLPLPGFLINVAQCQRRLGDLKTARATYQKFVLVAPDSPLLPQVRSMIAEIDGLLAKPEADKPAASEADEDAKPAVHVDGVGAGRDARAGAGRQGVRPGARARAAPALVAVGRDRRRGRGRCRDRGRPVDGRHDDNP